MFCKLPNLRDSVIHVANPSQQNGRNQSPHQNIDCIVKPLKINNIQKINRHKMRILHPDAFYRDVIFKSGTGTLWRASSGPFRPPSETQPRRARTTKTASATTLEGRRE